MLTKNATQAVVAVIGVTGLVAATICTFFIPEMQEERMMLIGGLIAAASTSGAWLFRLNGSK